MLATFTTAAKEELLSSFVPWSADECICAFESQSKKVHQGVAPQNLALHQGIAWSNSTTALGLRGAQLETRVRSRCTGKERDTESGLDNFDFRYYSSSMGRFMRPDEPFGGWDQNDPQSFNLYSYVRNSPTVNVDPDGHDCVYFSGGGSPYVKTGDCFSDKDEGIYVNGSVDVNSFKYHDSPSSWSYSYTAYDTGSLGVGTIGNARLPGPENRPEMDNGAMTPGFLGPGDLILFGPGRGLFEGGLETETRTVIGKMADLQAEGAVRQGERALADDLADMGSPKANWAQNSGKLREVMSEGKPIRDLSAGKPGSNTGFLRAERNLLQNNGWALRGDTWYPPGT